MLNNNECLLWIIYGNTLVIVKRPSLAASVGLYSAMSADFLAYPIRILQNGPKKKGPLSMRYRSGELYNLDLSKTINERRSRLTNPK